MTDDPNLSQDAQVIRLAQTPQPPYYAVVFTSQRTDVDEAGYIATADRMEELAAVQPGFLGIDSARGTGGLGMSVSYWKDLDSIRLWREQAEHQVAQQQGKSTWYAAYSLRVCRVEAEQTFERGA